MTSLLRVLPVVALAVVGVACSADTSDAESEPIETVGAAVTGTSEWQLAATFRAVPPEDTFPCDDSSDPNGCHSPGLPAGTYTVATQDVPVEAGDVLVLRGQVSVVNNLDYTLATAKAWITCGSSVVSPYASKDFARWWTQGNNGHRSGNHHGAVWTNGICAASADGTMTVKLIAQTNRDGITFGNTTYSPLLVQQYRPIAGGFSGSNIKALLIASNPKKEITLDERYVDVPTLQLTDFSKIYPKDLLYLTSQGTGRYPGGPADGNMFGTHVDHTNHGWAENVGYDYDTTAINATGFYTTTTAIPTTLTLNGYVSGDTLADKTYFEEATSSYEAFAFRGGAGGWNLTHYAHVAQASNQSITSGTTYTLATTTLSSAHATLLDLTAQAQVVSSIATTQNSAKCTVWSTVYEQGTKNVYKRSVGYPREFSYPYSQHPLLSEQLFWIKAGSFDVALDLSCTGNFGGALSAVASGGAIDVVVYTNTASPAKPPVPATFSAGTITSTSIQGKWTTGGGSTYQYVLAYAEGAIAPSCTDASELKVGAVLYKVVGNLKPSTTYSFALCAVNAVGVLSDPITLTAKTSS